MSHELEMVDGKASMAWAGEVPWHGLGKEVPADLTPLQMLEAAGLDWEVVKVPVRALHKGDAVKGLDYQALVRATDNQFLSMVSEKWEPLQNIEAFNFFNEFIEAGEMEMNTAGLLIGRPGSFVNI